MASSTNHSVKSRIYFHNLGKLKWTIIPLIVGLLLLISELFNWFDLQEHGSWSYIGTIGHGLIFLTLLFLLSPYFIKRNVVQWNEKGMQVKIGSLFGTTIRYSDVTEIHYEDNRLMIMMNNGKQRVIDVNHILQKDIEKLIELVRAKI